MSGIAGCSRPGARVTVERMLERMGHRGPAGQRISETANGTLGVAWTGLQGSSRRTLENSNVAQDRAGIGRLAEAVATPAGLELRRDALGIAPLYSGRTPDGALYFASEVKALLPVARSIKCVPPGYQSARAGKPAYRLAPQPSMTESPRIIAAELRSRLSAAVRESISSGGVGCWLSGGLDSSVMAALAGSQVRTLHTFAAGLPGATDLQYARQVARHIHSEHHEITVTYEEMLAALTKVIYHLESFDALLVRSSIINYIAGRVAANHVPGVLSGEGGDELFAGYAYLKKLAPALIEGELIDITGRLHNTALQRVDRCSAAHGLVAFVPFLAPDVVSLALRIPTGLKLRNNVEKWIVRQAVTDLLPTDVLLRTKSKFWEGAGVGDLLARHADSRITDRDFSAQRVLPNGWRLRTKEEMLYYRMFREHFGEFEDLDWMGRTKGAPEA